MTKLLWGYLQSAWMKYCHKTNSVWNVMCFIGVVVVNNQCHQLVRRRPYVNIFDVPTKKILVSTFHPNMLDVVMLCVFFHLLIIRCSIEIWLYTLKPRNDFNKEHTQIHGFICIKWYLQFIKKTMVTLYYWHWMTKISDKLNSIIISMKTSQHKPINFKKHSLPLIYIVTWIYYVV